MVPASVLGDLVVVQAQLTLGQLEVLLDRPAQAAHPGRIRTPLLAPISSPTKRCSSSMQPSPSLPAATCARWRAPPTERRARTRAHLLESAADVFARRGFHGASVEEVAEVAGYSKGAVYSNLASKDELFLAVLQDRMRSQIEFLERLTEQASTATSEPSWRRCSLRSSARGWRRLSWPRPRSRSTRGWRCSATSTREPCQST